MNQSTFTIQNGAEPWTEGVIGATRLVFSTQAPPTSKRWPISSQVVIAVLAFLIIAINAVTLVAIVKISSFGPRMKLLTGSLTTADLLLGLSILLPRAWPLGAMASRHPLCYLRYGLVVLSIFSTCLTVLTMAADRTVAVVFPYLYRYLVTFRTLVGCMVGVWGLAVLLTVVSLVGGFPEGMKCSLLTSQQKVIPRHGMGILGIVMMLCVVTVTACYVTIGVTMRKQHVIRSAMAAAAHVQDSAQSSFQRSEKRTTITIFCLTLCFLVGYGPVSVVCLLWAWQKGDGSLPLSSGVTGISIFLCSMLNLIVDPVIYFWRLREALAASSIVCCRHRRDRPRVTPLLESGTQTSDPSGPSLRVPGSRACSASGGREGQGGSATVSAVSWSSSNV